MFKGFAIALAWPETLCKRAGAWYDYPLHYAGISKKGYYKVGHSALILVDPQSGKCHYFDFGRYHTPHGSGRVRSEITDHDLSINTKAKFSVDFTKIENLEAILKELYKNESTHGSGAIYGAVVNVNFQKALAFVDSLQHKGHIPYGPFVPNGTNCSRFVNSAILSGVPTVSIRTLLQTPPTLTPTPMWNVRAIGNAVRYEEKTTVEPLKQTTENISSPFNIKSMIYDRITQSFTRS